MSKMIKTALIIILGSFAALDSDAQQAGFRGLRRNGIYNEKGLLKIWPASGPQLLWEITGIGKGQSSATVTDDAIYITGRKDEQDVLTCLDQNGRKKWDLVYGISSVVTNFPESRCTPSFADPKWK